MFSSVRTSTVVLALSALFSIAKASDVAVLPRQDSCPNGVEVAYISTNLVYYPILINTLIEANTIININGGVTININNAPTNLSTIVTGVSTVTSTVTDTTTATATVTGTPSNEFTIQVSVTVGTKKRQVQKGYVAFSGELAIVVTDITLAAVFTIVDGQLMTGGQFVGASSSDLSTGFGNFQLYATAPEVSVTWSFGALGGVISFSNGDFLAGAAGFCERADGTLFTTYTSSPTGFTCFVAVLIADGSLPSATSSAISASSASASSASSASVASVSASSTSSDTSAAPEATGAARLRSRGRLHHAGMVRKQ